MWIVDKIKSGEIIIEKDDEAALRKCLNHCFPNDADPRNEEAIKNGNYFMANVPTSSWWLSGVKNSTGLPTISASDLWKSIIFQAEPCPEAPLTDRVSSLEERVDAIEKRSSITEETTVNSGFPFEVGDWVTVDSKPDYWNSTFNENSPMDIDDAHFPFTGKIKRIGYGKCAINEVVMDMGGYGWDYNPDIMRKATKEEIAYVEHGLKDGDLCFVWDEDSLIYLRYFSHIKSGKLFFYCDQHTYGDTASWSYFKKADGVELPER